MLTFDALRRGIRKYKKPLFFGLVIGLLTSFGVIFKSSVPKQTNYETEDMTNGQLTIDDIPHERVPSVDCSKLFERNPVEMKRAGEFQKSLPTVKASNEDSGLKKRASNCSTFVRERRYITQPISLEESDFPLAYSILIYKDVDQFERLLRAIYRPQNFYCVHVDKSSSPAVHDSVQTLVSCFFNVFLAPRRVDVVWGMYSVLEAELICMQELLRYKTWKYFINLTGQEFPLKTNWQIVKILKVFNGSNNMEGTIRRRNVERTASREPPPVNVTLAKGSVHIVATRAFVDFAVNDPIALEFLHWVNATIIPDETFFSSLNASPQLGVPGAYLGIPETDTAKNLFITRYKNWGDGVFNWPCHGKRIRMICIPGLGDLPQLASRPELFVNKFHSDYEPLVLDCMEELHYNRTQNEFLRLTLFNTSFYENLDFVRNHL